MYYTCTVHIHKPLGPVDFPLLQSLLQFTQSGPNTADATANAEYQVQAFRLHSSGVIQNHTQNRGCTSLRLSRTSFRTLRNSCRLSLSLVSIVSSSSSSSVRTRSLASKQTSANEVLMLSKSGERRKVGENRLTFILCRVIRDEWW